MTNLKKALLITTSLFFVADYASAMEDPTSQRDETNIPRIHPKVDEEPNSSEDEEASRSKPVKKLSEPQQEIPMQTKNAILNIKNDNNEEWDPEEEQPDLGPINFKQFKKDLVDQMFGGPVHVPVGVLGNKEPTIVNVPFKKTRKELEERLFGTKSNQAPVIVEPTEEVLPPIPPRDDKDFLEEDKDKPPLPIDEKIESTEKPVTPQVPMLVMPLAELSPPSPIYDDKGPLKSVEREEKHTPPFSPFNKDNEPVNIRHTLPNSVSTDVPDEIPQEALTLANLINTNLFGPHLEIDAHNYPFVLEGICLRAIGKTTAIRTLTYNHFLTIEYILPLSYIFNKNTSIRTLDLSKSIVPGSVLQSLGCALSKNTTLRKLIFPSNAKFELSDIDHFYNQISTNRGLRTIVWPNQKEILTHLAAKAKKKKGFFGSYMYDSHASLHLGIMHRDKLQGLGDEKEALKYLEISHKELHPQAAYAIGKLYERKKDFDNALLWYGHAKNAGYPKAFAKLGNFERGIWPKGSKKDQNYEAAFTLYKLGADLGDRECLYRLGRMYEAGKQVSKDLNIAGGLFYEALEHGYADAIVALGALYNNPEYKGYDLGNSILYLEWAKKYQKTAGTANKHLTYVGKM